MRSLGLRKISFLEKIYFDFIDFESWRKGRVTRAVNQYVSNREADTAAGAKRGTSIYVYIHISGGGSLGENPGSQYSKRWEGKARPWAYSRYIHVKHE